MDKHICKQCGKTYSYCRGCLLSPISYKENGYCSKECQIAAQKQREEVIQKDVEVVIEHEDMPTSEEEKVESPYFFTEKENDLNDYEQDYGEDI